MSGNFVLPPMGYGPGSQPPEEEGGELEYMPMPQDMRTFTMHLPEIDEIDADVSAALALMGEISKACERVAKGGANETFDLRELDEANRALIAETMGHGEVAVRMHGIPAIAAQESVFAGIWVLKGEGTDAIEVGPTPDMAQTRAFAPRMAPQGAHAKLTPAVVNAPPIVVELEDKSKNFVSGSEPHVVNLTLLPHTEEDLAWMDVALGKGSVEILSRGYGNCRVDATGLPHVWRVQFFNSMDTLILDTFEVCDMPEVAIAATEDLIDSAERLVEVLGAIS